jgi:hypothetical protein
VTGVAQKETPSWKKGKNPEEIPYVELRSEGIMSSSVSSVDDGMFG